MKGNLQQNHFWLIVLMFLIASCATYKPKYAEGEIKNIKIPNEKEIAHSFYLIGDAGLSPMGDMNVALKSFKKRLTKASENSTAIFLGDNIYPAGLPDPVDSTEAYLKAENHLDAQLETLTDYKGKPIFIPGNHDWYNEGTVGLERQQKYIQQALNNEDVFFPEDGCPFKIIEVNDKVMIIAVDTQWYLANWDKQPNINDKCDIKTREKFFLEIESEIKKNLDKTIVMALHHPMFSYGVHGGQYSFKRGIYPKDKMIPLPVLGSIVNLFRKASGASVQDMQNQRYMQLKKRLVTLAQYSKKLIFVSGHEHALQYIVEENTPQIVSGSGAKKGATRLLNGSKFSTGQMGYSILDVYTDGSSIVRFYGIDEFGEEELLYSDDVLSPDWHVKEDMFDDNFPTTTLASIYTDEEVAKSEFFRKTWGHRYRKDYNTKVEVPTVRLDTLFGGLEPVRKGGGNQSKSLRLRHKSGKEYVMRAMRKVSELYLQAMIFQDQYLMDELERSYLQEFMMDFYTGANPYAPFTVGEMSDAIGLYHTNPKLYYVPKQSRLGDFNLEFGDELYMIEEHAGDGHGEVASFGFSNELKSTDAMFEDIRDDEEYSVDTDLYLRARLFDMILGDWDRHVDQWRWAEFKKPNGDIVYRPVPRDRDMVYSQMGDGFFMSIATRIVPDLRLMEGFKDEIRNVRGFNSSPKTYVLDIAMLNGKTREDWLKQAAYIQENLTEAVIDRAMLGFPEEVRDGNVDMVKRTLLSRINLIKQDAISYFEIINKYPVVIGTDKDDWFDIEYTKDEVTVTAHRIIGGEKKRQFFKNTFKKGVTKEVWIYGLDDDDMFKVTGARNSGIKVRLVGGHNNDIYDIGEGKGTYVYDFKTKKNTFKDVSKGRVRLTNNYDVNTYRPLDFITSRNRLLPTIGFNPDDGIKVGIDETYTHNGFRKNPFTQRHNLYFAYYFATSGYELDYTGEFANITNNANLEIAARLTSPNFSINFFGIGNETENDDDNLGMDYNRVRMKTFNFAPSLVWCGQLGSILKLGMNYNRIRVEETEDRFVNTFYQDSGQESLQSFIGAEGEYSFQNSDNIAFPTLGMAILIKGGYKSELNIGNGSFGYVIPSLSLNYKMTSNGRLVLATKWQGHINIGNGYEFYQAASIGGLNGLRGHRSQRFAGKRAYFQNTDLRLSLGKGRTRILPTAFGVYGGFDYGRVWEAYDDSNIWHTSFGGGLFLNMADLVSARVAMFNSKDGNRFTFGFGFAF